MVDKAGDSVRSQFSRALGRVWWMPAIRGVLLIVLGAYALFQPGMTAAVLTQIVGLFLVVDGVLALVGVAMSEAPARGWTIGRGLLAIVVGLFVFAEPVLVAGIAARTVLYLLAFVTLICGALQLIAAWHMRSRGGDSGVFVGGILAVLFGVLLLVAPIQFGLIIVRLIGIFAILAGLAILAFALRLRSFGRKLRDS